MFLPAPQVEGNRQMPLHDAAIIGYGETKIEARSGSNPYTLAGRVLDEVLTRTGIEKDAIDGLIMTTSLTMARTAFQSQCMAEYLGLELNYVDLANQGGCSPTAAVARAAAAIDAGLCETVFIVCADSWATEDNFTNYAFHEEWTDPYGLMGPPGSFGLLSNRYKHQYGLDFNALAKLAITQRNHALLNDLACEKLRKPITVEDYMNSRMIADPIRILDCVMPADGANGLLVTSRKIARDRGIDNFVVPVGYGEKTNLGGGKSIVDITRTGHEAAGKKAFAQAGMTPKDVASFHPYDDFIIAIMLQLEMLGFCEPGQGCAFVNETNFAFDGDLPLNTSGGQISAGQAGLAGGGTNLVEAVRQLMGEGGARQVRNRNNALVTGIGWIPYARNWASSSVMLLTPNA